MGVSNVDQHAVLLVLPCEVRLSVFLVYGLFLSCVRGVGNGSAVVLLTAADATVWWCGRSPVPFPFLVRLSLDRPPPLVVG